VSKSQSGKGRSATTTAANPARPVPAPSAPAPGRRSSSRASSRPPGARPGGDLPEPSPLTAFSGSHAGAASDAEMNELTETPRPVMKVDPKLVNNWKTKSGSDLSDAEVLAMPEGEYMSEKQLDFFRHKLTQFKNDLLSNADETTEHLREDTSIVPDPADRATIEEEHALELRTRDRERKLLKKIEQALMRIDTGDYGYCDETGEPIGLARLMARPTATLSLEAQQRRELKQKMYGD